MHLVQDSCFDVTHNGLILKFSVLGGRPMRQERLFCDISSKPVQLDVDIPIEQRSLKVANNLPFMYVYE